MTETDIYSYIKTEENSYEQDEIQLGDNWYFNLRNHIQLIFHLKNGVFYTGENNWLRSFKNIMQPMLDLAYWTEDLEVKDVEFFIESDEGKELSFLIKKYHDEIYVKEHDLDQLFDEITETDIDYGGVLVQKGVERPEVITLNSIAFCDQVDMLGGPVFFKSNLSPSKLMQMGKFGWGDTKNGATISLEDLVVLASNRKDPIGTKNKEENRVPGKTIEIYVGRGDMPSDYLNDDDDMETQVQQLQIVAFYTDEDNEKHGVTLYRKEDHDELMYHTSNEVFGRAIGRGVGETLLPNQVWTNFISIHKTAMLEAGSKVPLYTDDPSYTSKNRIQDMENLEITTIDEGKSIQQVPTMATANVQLFDNEEAGWLEHAQLAASAFDPVLGKEAVSGTTFRGQERTVAQGRGSHDRRRGKRAKFIEKIYREWIIPDIVKEITKGNKFLATLSVDELSWVSDRVATNQLNDKIKDKMLNSPDAMTKQEGDELKQLLKSDFLKTGNRQLVEVLKGEFKGIEVKMGINIANKQKNLADLSDKVLSIFQFAFEDPVRFQQSMQVPALAKAFSDILEFSGMSIADFSSLMDAPEQQLAQGQAPPVQEGGGIDSLLQTQEKELA